MMRMDRRRRRRRKMYHFRTRMEGWCIRDRETFEMSFSCFGHERTAKQLSGKTGM